MAGRSKPQQSKHTQRVRQRARQLKEQGYNVKADLPEFPEKPGAIGKGGHVPDIEATKRGIRKIIEVETPETLDVDKEQQEAFRRSAAQRNRTTFEIEVAD